MWSQQHAALYWVDILAKCLHRYTPAADQRESWTFGEQISAVAERAVAPGLLVTLRSGFAFFDPATGQLERLLNPEPERPGNRFNDGKCDAAGRFWGGTTDFACTQATGALYCLDAQRRCARHFDGIHIANGPTWSLDGRTLYLSEAGLRRVYAFDFDMDSGSLSNRRVWLQFTDSDGAPDGMTTDADGRVWIAHWGGSCVTCRDASGRLLARIDFPVANVASCAFGGPELATLYVTSGHEGLAPADHAAQPLAGAVFAVETDARGLPAARFAG